MALDRTPTRRDATLSPSRWSRPGAGAILRWVLVAALLALALGALYLREPTSSCRTPSAGSTGDKAGTTPEVAGPARSAGSVGGTASPGPDGASPSTGSGPAARPGGSPSGPTGSATPGGSGVPVPAGTVGVPIRLAEPAALTVARPGARVDLLAAPGGDPAGRAPKPTVLATRVLVLDVLGPGQTDGAASAIYLALRPEQAHRAVGMPESTRFAIIVRS
ncbi:hypothetical protein GCM10022225_23090 [Plantactinospora mayteni]|uniref:Flagellar biosynthesis protein FlgA n=1 Tax=Plantactinospora mayteni TaxID=566021 RepID=A0ABQ4EP92_9ACTN|nr:flagellar biosynthesis protein FlgA [Plantactinospora mayteni]GIG96493.1 hypothetical protein Pma05_30660 [Plantactinospora mayteni]